MRARSAGAVACAVLAAALGPAAHADSLQDLLERLRSDQAQESRAIEERLARFRATANERRALRADATQSLRAQEARIQELERKIARGNKEILARRGRLDELSAHYREAFSLARLWAVDLQQHLRDSLISAEFPGRSRELLPLSSDARPITVDDIRLLLYHTLQEADQQGRISRFAAPVTGADGGTEEREVVRIGAFTASSDGMFLSFPPETRGLLALPRQPQRSLRGIAEDFQSDPSANARPAVLDPSRGAILALLTAAPDLAELVGQGGAIGYLIILLGAFGVLFALQRIAALGMQLRRTLQQYRDMEHPRPDNPLGRVALAYREHQADMDAEALEDRVHEAIGDELPRLTFGLNMLRVLAAVAPLLGLLGTVVGMIQTFQDITLFGAGDARMMAGGISQALVTTALGLSAAIPILLLLTLARSFSNRSRMILEEHSLGLLARAQRPAAA